MPNPKFTPTRDLIKSALTGDKASYEYIIGLSFRQLLREACDKRARELADARAHLADLLADTRTSDTEFIGKKTWLRELDALEAIIDDGVAHGWS